MPVTKRFKLSRLNSMEGVSSLVNADRAATIPITPIYPERRGIFKRESWTRSLADDETSLGNPRNGMESTVSDRRRGANPAKNDLGMIRPGSFVDDMRSKSVSAGNGSCISKRMVSRSVPSIATSSILRMRSLCLNAARTLGSDHGLV